MVNRQRIFNRTKYAIIALMLIAIIVATTIITGLLQRTVNAFAGVDGNTVMDELRISVYDGITAKNMSIFVNGNTGSVVDYGMGKITNVLTSNGISLSEEKKSLIKRNLIMNIENTYAGGKITTKENNQYELSNLSKAYIANVTADAVIATDPPIDKKERVDAGTIAFKKIMDIDQALQEIDTQNEYITSNAKNIQKLAKAIGINLEEDSSADSILKKLEGQKTVVKSVNTKQEVSKDDLNNIMNQIKNKQSVPTNSTNQEKTTVQEALSDTQKTQLSSIDQIITTINSIQTKVNTLEKTNKTLTTDISAEKKISEQHTKDISENKKTIDQNAKDIKENKAAADKSISEVKTDLKTTNDNLATIKTNLSETKTALEKSISDKTKEITTKISEVSKTVENNKTELTKTVEETKTSLNKLIDDLKAALDKAGEDNKAAMEKLNKELGDQIAARAEENKKEIEKSNEELNKSISDLKNEKDKENEDLNKTINDNREAREAKDRDLDSRMPIVISGITLSFDENNQAVIEDQAFASGVEGIDIKYTSQYGIKPTYELRSEETTGKLIISLDSAPEETIKLASIIVYR